MRMRRTTFVSVVCLAVPYFSTLSDKRHDFREKVIERKIVFWISLQFCVTHFSFQEELGTFN